MGRAAAVSLMLLACGETAPADEVIYDSDPTGPQVGPGTMGGPPVRRILGNTSGWHEHRLRDAGVPLLVMWETINTHGCRYVRRIVVIREGGSPRTSVRARRTSPPAGGPDCMDPPATPEGSPFESSAVSIEWTERSGCGESASHRRRIALDGNGHAAID